MTIRDNDDKGYNEAMGTIRDDQLKKEEARMRTEDRGGAKQPTFSLEGDLDTIDGGVAGASPDMGVPPNEWEELLDRLAAMQSTSDNFDRKNKTMNFLWEKYGSGTTPTSTRRTTPVA